MASNFPTSLDTASEQPSPGSTTDLDAAGFEHDVVHANHSTALIAVETKVGVGSSTPVADSVLAGSAAGVSGWDTAPSLAGLVVDTSTLVVDAANNRVGIGTTSPSRRLSINDSNNAYMSFDEGGTESWVVGYEGGANNRFIIYGPASSRDYRMVILDDGKVGIGTTAPANKLHLAGTTADHALVFTNTANTVGKQGYRIGFDNNRLAFQRASDTGGWETNHMFIDQDTGNVMVGGTTQPGTDAVMYTEGVVSSYNPTAGTTGVSIKAYSDVGGSQSLKFDVRTDGDVNYDGVLTDTSDVRLKTDITDTDLGLSFIEALRPVSYRRTSGTRRHYGFIAQEVAAVLGDDADSNAIWVERRDLEEGESSVENPQGLRYNHLIAPLVKAVQELSARIETLETV